MYLIILCLLLFILFIFYIYIDNENIGIQNYIKMNKLNNKIKNENKLYLENKKNSIILNKDIFEKKEYTNINGNYNQFTNNQLFIPKKKNLINEIFENDLVNIYEENLEKCQQNSLVI